MYFKYIFYTDMRRHHRLSVHRKNEFRKKYANQRGYNLTVTPCLLVRVPLHLVNMQCKTSSNVPALLKPLKVCVAFDAIEQATLNFDTFHASVKVLKIIPQGMGIA